MNSMETDIVRRALRKAFANGYGPPSYKRTLKTLKDAERDTFTTTTIQGLLRFVPVFELIYGHNFAKALWGEQELEGLAASVGETDIFTGTKRTHYWQFHLQQMIVANDPIKYLGENL